jgi:hypothetical protein
MNTRIRKAVALALAALSPAAGAINSGAPLPVVSNAGTTSSTGFVANFAWDGNNSSRGTPNVFNGTSQYLGWAHNSKWYDIHITKPGHYTLSLVRTNPAQKAFNPAFTLWPVGEAPFDPANCSETNACGDANQGGSPSGTHSYNQVAAPSPTNASAWLLGPAGPAANPDGDPLQHTLAWVPAPGKGAVTGFIGYANSGPGGWRNGMPVKRDGGIGGPDPDFNLSRDQDLVLQGGYVNTAPGGGLGGSTLGSRSNANAPLGGGYAALNLYDLAAGHYLLALGGSCQKGESDPDCPKIGASAYRLEITEIAGSAPQASAQAAGPVRAGSPATLDGSGSFDPDGDALTYAWSQTAGPAVVLQEADTKTARFTAPASAAGQTLGFSLTVRSADGENSAATTVAVTGDNNPPVVKVAGQSVLEGAEVTLRASVTDPDGDKAGGYRWEQTGGTPVVTDRTDGPTLSFMAPGAGAGTHELTFTVTVTDDYPANPKSAAATATVTVSDDPTRLDCSAAYASRPSLKPNKALVPVKVLGIAAPFPYTLSIIGVTSDEPVRNKAGKDTTGPDAKIQKGRSTRKKPRTDGVLLRAERQGNGSGNGRVYAVNFKAETFRPEDGNQSCTGSVRVEAPWAPGQAAVDDGQNYAATRKR